MTERQTGVLLVGVLGRTAQTLVAGARLMARGVIGNQFGITGRDPLARLNLITPLEMVWGGWETVLRPPSPEITRLAAETGTAIESLQPAMVFPGFASSLDFDDTPLQTATVDEIRDHIRSFRQSNCLDHVIVVNLSNPPRANSTNPRSYYAHAAVEEGCDFVEFTPTDSITDKLVAAATENACQVAGRDGSTGQTFLKLVLADALEAKGLEILSWYSTNILGNHDGLVLADHRYAGDKLSDKRQPLEGRVADASNHVVRIDFVAQRDDEKEAWDSVRLEGWLGSRHRLHVTWEGADSFLAAPLILDLVRLLELSHRRGDPPGLRTELSPFFKNPQGVHRRTWANQLADLISFYAPDASAP